MVNIISDYIPPFSPLPNIAPFTYKDGETYLSTLENLRTYVNITLVDFINTNIATYGGPLGTQITDLINTVNAALTAQSLTITNALNAESSNVNTQLTSQNTAITAQVTGQLSTQNTAVTAQLSAQNTANNTSIGNLTTYVNNQVASIISNSITIADPMLKTIINNVVSVSRVALDLLYAAPLTAEINRAQNSEIKLNTQTAQPLNMSLRRTNKNLNEYDDSIKPLFRIIGVGGSIGAGATLSDPNTQSPISRFYAMLTPKINRLNNVIFSKSNGSINTSVISQANTDYITAKANAGGNPSIVIVAYGINDGMPPAYHAGQTLPNIYQQGINFVRNAQSDGADVIIFTTTHPRVDIMTDSNWTIGGPSTYPTSNPIPALTETASIVNITTLSGATIQASYRHLRVNDALRRVALDTGCVLIDVESYWFEAIAANGYNALFNNSEYMNPNLLGHQLSYWKAIDDFVNSYTRSIVSASNSLQTNAIYGYTTRNSNFTLSSTATAIPFTSAPISQGFTWSITYPTRITIMTAGHYLISSSGQWLINSTTNGIAYILVNGSQQFPSVVAPSSSGSAALVFAQTIDLAIGDYIEIMAISSGAYPWISANKVNLTLLAFR